MRTIDADALYGAILDHEMPGGWDEFDDGIDVARSRILDLVENAPTVSASWIPVVDKLPAPDLEVQICTRSKNGSRNIDKGYHTGDRWVRRGVAEVTHWMPLPSLPADEASP